LNGLCCSFGENPLDCELLSGLIILFRFLSFGECVSSDFFCSDVEKIGFFSVLSSGFSFGF